MWFNKFGPAHPLVYKADKLGLHVVSHLALPFPRSQAHDSAVHAAGGRLGREMRAALAATLKRAFTAAETALRPCVASKCLDFHLHRCQSSDPAEQRHDSYILGRDLPDIWAAPSSVSPLLPPPEPPSSFGNPISRLDSLRNNREQLVVIGFWERSRTFCVVIGFVGRYY